LKRGAALALGLAVLFLLYGFGLDRVGMLGPDEPRYAAIGRAMAESGDWVTPRLWSTPWFEKPALLYWMTAVGYKLGLNPDLAPRVPVALASVAFLAFFWSFLRREFGEPEALYATAILATCAGWLTYGHVAVTDLPLAVCFSAAALLLLPGEGRTKPVASGIFLGLAVLAKGLVPLVLILPAFWFLRKRAKEIAIVMGVAVLVAAPWYALVTPRSGRPFLEEFFWKHHFARFATGSLQHVRPVWFFVPVLLAATFPWTPLLALLFDKQLYADGRVRFLAAYLGFGLLFFSFSENKLPGYLLPLLPGLTALLGIAVARGRRACWALAGAAALLCLIPVVAEALPAALLNGASRVKPAVSPWQIAGGLATGIVVWALCSRRSRIGAAGLVATGVTAGVIYLVWVTFPVLETTVSARQFWRSHQDIQCVDAGNRGWQYGVAYYAGRAVPLCEPAP